jgi:hypothetical protein
MEVVFILLGLFACIGIYKLATRYKNDPRSLEDQVKNLQSNKFSTGMNRWSAVKEIKPSEKRTALAKQLTSEATAVIALGSAQLDRITAEHALEVAPARLEELRRQEISVHEHTLALEREATDRKVSLLGLDQLRIEEETARVEIEKHRELKEIDKDVYQFEKEIDVKGAIIARVASVYEVNLLTGQLEQALLERERWLELPESSTQTEMVEQLNKNVKVLREAIDVKGQRLIQGDSRAVLGTGDED